MTTTGTTVLSRRHRILLLALPLAGYTFFFIIPNVLNFALSFTDWNSYRSEINFIGGANFVQLFEEGTLWNSLRVTLIFAMLVALFQNGAGLALAVLLEKPTRNNALLRSLFFIPVLLSPLAAGYLFRGILAYDGPVNEVAMFITGTAVHIPFLTSETWTIVTVAAVHAWKYFGLTMLIYLAGLAAIPADVVEAARMDGASPWRTFWSVRWPMLAPAVTANITLTLIGSLTAFDVVLATTGGGPGMSTQVFNIAVFQQFGSGAFGVSTAMALVLFLTVVAIAVPLITVLRRRELNS